MEKINYPRFIVSAIVFMIIAQIVHTLGAYATMGYYADAAYAGVWSGLMMPGTGAPGTSFMYTSIAFNFITGALLLFGFLFVKQALPGGTEIRRAMYYALLIFLVAGIPGALAMALLINLPVALIAAWTIEGLVIYVLAFAAVTKIYK